MPEPKSPNSIRNYHNLELITEQKDICKAVLTEISSNLQALKENITQDDHKGIAKYLILIRGQLSMRMVALESISKKN